MLTESKKKSIDRLTTEQKVNLLKTRVRNRLIYPASIRDKIRAEISYLINILDMYECQDCGYFLTDNELDGITKCPQCGYTINPVW